MNLLGISGEPAALSEVPPSRRPPQEVPLVGRDDLLAEAAEADGDFVIYGVPGVGKTYLLHKLAESGWGLFLASSNEEALANALRREAPQRVIVDDAHFAPDRLALLIRLRRQLGLDFSIVATSWPQWEADVATQLNASQSKEVGLLTQDEMLEVLEGLGVHGPVELQAELIGQARVSLTRFPGHLA